MSKLVRRQLGWTLGLVLLLAAPVGQVEARVTPDGQGPAVNATNVMDFMRHPSRDRYYSESWTTIIRTHQGHDLYLTFLYTNMGVFSGSTAVNLSLAMPGQLAENHRFDHSTKEFKQDATTGTISIGPNRMQLQGKELIIGLNEPELQLTLRLTGWVNGVKFQGGKLFLNEDRSKWVQTFYHLPRATVTGSAVIKGTKLVLDGNGYMDHFVQNVLGTDYSARWYTLRFFAPDHTVNFLVFDMTPAYGKERVIRVMVTDRKQLLYFGEELELQADNPKQDLAHKYNTRFRFSSKLGGVATALEGTTQGTRLHDRDAVVERLSWAERKVAGLVAGNPVFYRMEATTQITLTPPGSGPVQLNGIGLVESVVMQEE